MAIAANKSDMYEFEEVPEEEGMALAKQINAIFQTTKSDTLLFLNATEAAAELEARFTRKDGMNRRCFRKSNVSL